MAMFMSADLRGEDIVKYLYEGNDIRCVLNLGSSKYSFALEAGNIDADN